MKKNPTSLLALLLVLTLLFSLMAGCGSNSASEAAASSAAERVSSTEEPAEEPVDAPEEAAEEESAEAETQVVEEPSIYPLTEEPVTFTYFTGFESEFKGVIESMDDFASIAKAEEMTNVHIDWKCVAGPAMVENMLIMFASGDTTDFISSATDFYAGGGNQAVSDGILLDLTDYVDECMPNYMNLLNENPNIKLEVTESDGSYTYIRKILEENFVSIGMAIRQDWLDELNLNVPTTYDELTNVLEAFHSEYGCKDTIYLDKEANFGFGYLAYGYGTPGYRIGDHTESQYYQVDGAVKSSLIQDGYKDFLKMLAQWYAAGYISSDFVSADSRPGGDDQTTAINSGNTGVWKTSINVLGSVDSWLTAEGAEITALDWIGTDGTITNTFADLSHSDQQNISIGANCANPELACQWADFWFSDYGMQIWNWGVEGGCYEIVDGKVQFLDSLYDNEWGISASAAVQAYSLASYSLPSMQYADRFSSFYSELQAATYDTWNTNSNDSNAMIYTDIAAAYSEEYSAIINDICTYAETMILSFITGTADIDKEWDNYVASLKSMNLDRAVELMQLSYDEYLAK